MRGEIAFAPALRERVALLKGLRADVVARVLAERIEIMPGARVLVATMRAAGAHTALVSGGFTAFVEPVAEKIGFHETRANLLVSESGAFTGLVAEPILGAEAKEETLVELTARLGLAPAGDAGGRRRRQRRRHDPPRRPRCGLSRQAGAAQDRRCDDRPRRPARAALPAGIQAGGVRGWVRPRAPDVVDCCRSADLLRVLDLERDEAELLVGAGDEQHGGLATLLLQLVDPRHNVLRLRHVGLADLHDDLAGLDALLLRLAAGGRPR